MKKNLLLPALLFFAWSYKAQVIYGNSFSTLSLQTYTTLTSTTKFTTVPLGFTLINDGLKNNIGTLTNPNKPFNEPLLKTTGWAVVFNEVENDTFLVSTSWLDTLNIATNRWLITPAISNVNANTVLTWLAKSPDASFSDGYEVYGTSNLLASNTQDFPVGNRLYALADGNTSGGGEKDTWTRRSIALGSFAGQTLRFAFRNNSKDMYQLWIDDIQVINLSSNLDAALTAELPKKYLLVNATDSVKINLNNAGATRIDAISVSYQIGNSSINTESISLPNGISYGQSIAIKFALPFSLNTQGFYQVKAWLNSVNNVPNQNALNDTCVYAVSVLNASAPKTVLLEQFVSANNGEGPDAQDKLLGLQSPTLIVINIHDQDSIKEMNSAALITDYKKNLPTAMADRTYFNDIQSVSFFRPAYSGRVNTRASAVTPANVSIINKTYNAFTKQLSFTVKADFIGEVRGDYRINAYLSENHVSGPVNDNTLNGFNQLNNYYNVPWSTYYQKGLFIASENNYLLNYWEFRHQNALVYAFDGAYGSASAITSTASTLNQSYQKTFTLALPSPTNGSHKFNPDNLYIVGFIAEYSADKNQRSVLNAVKEKVTSAIEAVGIEEFSENTNLSVYPNPSTGVFYLNEPTLKNYTVDVFDVLGKLMRKIEVSNNRGIEPIDLTVLPQGIYIFKIKAGLQQYTEKIIIQK